jgi:hypothetical protein
MIDDLYGDTIFLRFIEGTDRKCALCTANLYIVRQRINQLLTKTADL